MKRRLLPTVMLASGLVAGDAMAVQDPAPAAAGGRDAAPAAAPAQLDERPILAALREADPYVRSQRLAEQLATVGAEDVPAIRAALDTATSGAGMALADLELLVRAWARVDPPEAMRWAFNVAMPHYHYPAVDVAVEEWAEREPEEAAAQLALSSDSYVRELAQTVQLALVRGWFRADREGLLAYIRELGAGFKQQRSILGYALELQRREGSDAVIRWAAGLPDEGARFKKAAFRQVTTALAWVDPPASERFCEAHCDGPFGEALRTAIVRVRLGSGHDPVAVLGWLTRTAEAEALGKVLPKGFAMWARNDRAAALSWMEAQIAAEAPWVSDLHGVYAIQLAAESQAEAVRWAGRVENPRAREALLVRIARRWLKEDPEAAEAWLESSSLSEAARERARDLAVPEYLPRADAS